MSLVTILSSVRLAGISITASANTFLEYEDLSFEILYRGDSFDEEAYRDIFHRLQEENYFDFEIKHRRFSDY